MLFAVSLTGCSANSNSAKKDLKDELANIKEGKIDASENDVWEALHIYSTKGDRQELENVMEESLKSILSEFDFDIKSVKATDASAHARVKIHAYDVGKVLSQDDCMTKLILYMDSAEGKTTQQALSYFMGLVTESHFVSDIETEVFMTYSEEDGKYHISYTEDFLSSVFGGTNSYTYEVSLSDIIGTAKQEHQEEIKYKGYDDTKVLNLPKDNKTTISSPSDPIAMDETGICDNLDYFYEEKRFMLEIRVKEVVRGEEALILLQNADIENEMPDAGKETIIIKVEAGCLKNNAESKNVGISMDDFSFLTSGGEYINNKIVFGLPEKEEIGEDKTAEICAAFDIPNGEDGCLIFCSYMDTSLCFSIK